MPHPLSLDLRNFHRLTMKLRILNEVASVKVNSTGIGQYLSWVGIMALLMLKVPL
jgi:hypothetical protein